MKKSLLAVLTAAMIFSMSTLTAFAASPTVGSAAAPVATQKATTSVAAVASGAAYGASATVSEEYALSAVSDTTVNSAAVAAQNLALNDLDKLGTLLGNATLKNAAKSPSTRVIATLRFVGDVKPVSAKPGADGKYHFKVFSPYIYASKIQIGMHYNETTSAWELVDYKTVKDGEGEFASASCSPFAIVELSVVGTVKSPKTGETAPVAMMIVLLGVAGAAVCTKKYFA